MHQEHEPGAVVAHNRFTPMIATALVFLTLIGITTAAVLAFGWAAQNGQFHDQHAGARSIFDADEPEGEMTDAFPGARPTKPEAQFRDRP